MSSPHHLIATTSSAPPKAPSPRFTLELEFVLSLANPYYLSHLAVTYPYLLNKPASTGKNPNIDEDSDADRFAFYLAYLYKYWRTPKYSKYLSHPGAVLRNLELLQQENFRRDIIRPDVIARLLEGRVDGDGKALNVLVADVRGEGGEEEEDEEVEEVEAEERKNDNESQPGMGWEAMDTVAG